MKKLKDYSSPKMNIVNFDTEATLNAVTLSGSTATHEFAIDENTANDFFQWKIKEILENTNDKIYQLAFANYMIFINRLLLY